MPLTLVDTPGAANANTYPDIDWANAYFEARVPLDPAWDEADSPEALLVMATRTLDAAFRGQKILVPEMKGQGSYWKIGRKWKGTPASTTQKLAWPRIGLYHDNGSPVAADEIPWELKDADSELAGQLGLQDRTLDNKVITLGISSAKAGSAAVTFRDNQAIFPATLPQAVIDLIPPSWYEEEQIETTGLFDFATVLP